MFECQLCSDNDETFQRRPGVSLPQSLRRTIQVVRVSMVTITFLDMFLTAVTQMMKKYSRGLICISIGHASIQYCESVSMIALRNAETPDMESQQTLFVLCQVVTQKLFEQEYITKKRL